MVVWVIGASGLLGRSVATAVTRRDGWRLLECPPLPWTDPERFADAVGLSFNLLLDTSRATDLPWAVVWAAGSVVTASPKADVDRELRQIGEAFSAMSARLGRGHPPGLVFYASSAGGVYGGSSAPPFTEASPVAPISPYGFFKIEAERLTREFASANHLSSLVGRIANLYGPGQRPDKAQGLISHLARAQFSPAPAMIYVPLENRRDYLYADDCADLVLDSLERLLQESRKGAPLNVTKILASGQAITLGALLGYFKAIAKAKPHVMLGSSPTAALQPLDLRLRSAVWPDLDGRELTPLPAGIRATINGILLEMQAPRLAIGSPTR
jgi:UDP-glucose 4-epimerase